MSILRIEGTIGTPSIFDFDGGKFFSASDLSDFFRYEEVSDHLEITLSTNGGSVQDGIEIYDRLVNWKREKPGRTITITAYKYDSIGSVIMLAGDVRKSSKHANPVIHEPRIPGEALAGEQLTPDKLAEIEAEMRECGDLIREIYKDALKLNASKMKELSEEMKNESGMSNDRLLYFGFATEIIGDNVKSTKKAKALYYTPLMVAMKKGKNKSKITMSLKTKMAAFFKKYKTAAVAVSLDDGTELYHEGENIVVDETTLYVDAELTTTLFEGTHTLDNGDVVEVNADGLVIAYAAPDADLAEELEALKAENAALKTANAKLSTEKNEAVALMREAYRDMAVGRHNPTTQTPRGGGGKDKYQALKDKVNAKRK